MRMLFQETQNNFDIRRFTAYSNEDIITVNTLKELEIDQIECPAWFI